MVGYKLISSGNIESVISLEEARAHSRLFSEIEDDILAQMLRSGFDHAQRLSKISLVEQTWVKTLDCFPEDCIIQIERSPVKSIKSLTYYDSDGDSQAVLSTGYYFDDVSGRLKIKDLPVLRDGIANVVLTFKTGYSDPDLIPSDLLNAVKMFMGYYFCKRADHPSQNKYLTAGENICNLYNVYI